MLAPQTAAPYQGVLYPASGPAQLTQLEQAQIIQGSHASLIMKILNADSWDPLDLTTVTALSMKLLNADGTQLALTLGSGLALSGAGTMGKLAVTLTAAQTVLLAVTDQETAEVLITLGAADPFKIQIPGAYAVVASIA